MTFLRITAALFVLWLAPPVQVNACDEGASAACDRKNVADLQLAVGLAALVPLALFLWDSRRRRRRSIAWLGLAVASYASWLVLADYAVSGERGRLGFLHGT